MLAKTSENSIVNHQISENMLHTEAVWLLSDTELEIWDLSLFLNTLVYMDAQMYNM